MPRTGAIAVAIALAVTVVAGVYAEHQNRVVHAQNERSAVSDRLGVIRARLEGNINSNIQLIRGLVSVIAADPHIVQDRFANIASGLFGNHSQLRNVAAAPGLVIGLMYPMEGNEGAIGLDYTKHDSQRDAALRARDSRKMILAGPVNLVQGGKGFIGRFPVFIDDAAGDEYFWGLVSAVIDVDQLYGDSGMLDRDLPFEIALIGENATGKNGQVFYGRKAVMDMDPVVANVILPTGAWQIAAVPRDGWSATPDNVWLIRALIVLAGALVIVPISVAGRLFDERQGYVRELQSRQEQLKLLSHRLKLALETSRIGVWDLNVTTGELIWDDRMKELYGLPDSDEPSEYAVWREMLHPEDRAKAEWEFDESLQTGKPYRSEFRVRLPDSEDRWIRANGARYTDGTGNLHIVGVNWDVSSDIELKEHLEAARRNAENRNQQLELARSRMEHNSLHDSLTGLPNRRYLDEVLQGKDGFGEGRIALLHVDLDRFKHINDTLGHSAGDAMLVHAAAILTSSVRDDDFVARIGGDEFVVVLRNLADDRELANLAGRIIEEMRRPVPFEGHECRFGVSVGIAVGTSDNADRSRLLVNADIALYRAKGNGRNRYEFFSNSLEAEIVRSKKVADDILYGLDRSEFLPYFQPQFDARTLDIVGVEALARWDHPAEGILPPDAFLKIADELNVVPLIDRTILEQTLWQTVRWKANGIDIPKVSVNVSAGRLHDDGLLESLNGLHIEPGTLSFELLESIFLDESNEVIAGNIRKLKRLGIDIEIDDFGTGYASIVSLLQLRPRRLKIDRRLIQPIVESKKQRQLVGSIIEIGQSLGIEVVAEGVETMKHAEMLRELGCHALQGYAFAAPMSAADLIGFVKNQRWRETG